jgi:hypothetical protein
VRIAVAGGASSDEVWARYDDPHRWAEWSPQIRRVDVQGRHLVVGLTGVVHPVVGLTVHFTVTAVDRDNLTWSWAVGRGPVSIAMHHGVTWRPEGSEAWLDVRTVVGLAYAPLARIALARLVRPATDP